MLDRRTFLKASATFAAGLAAGCAATQPAAGVDAEEHSATVAAMRPPKRSRPVVAVLADNAGAETTDYIVPWSVLQRSGFAEVHALALKPAPVAMRPALRIEPSATTHEFDLAYRDGADYVIVPALTDPRSPEVIAWIRRQRATGATVMSICAGALVLAHAGMLTDRDATTHWTSIDDMRRLSPSTRWRANRRYVADDGVVTTTGVSASLPASLALVEAIAGRPSADALAHSLGAASYTEAHDSAAFRGRLAQVYARGAINLLSGREELALHIDDGVDELALALTADAWSRTFRSRSLTVAGDARVRTRGGLVVIADRRDANGLHAVTLPRKPPGQALDAVLRQIAARYGDATAHFVAAQLEHPGRGATG